MTSEVRIVYVDSGNNKNKKKKKEIQEKKIQIFQHKTWLSHLTELTFCSKRLHIHVVQIIFSLKISNAKFKLPHLVHLTN